MHVRFGGTAVRARAMVTQFHCYHGGAAATASSQQPATSQFSSQPDTAARRYRYTVWYYCLPLLYTPQVPLDLDLLTDPTYNSLW